MVSQKGTLNPEYSEYDDFNTSQSTIDKQVILITSKIPVGASLVVFSLA